MSKVSSLGQYQGYSTPVANGYLRESRYLIMDDGCRIAIDVLRPTMNGQLLPGSLPAILHGTGYRRAYYFGETDRKLVGDKVGWKRVQVGDLITGYEKSLLGKQLIDHGYNLVCVDLRGTGASFGTTHSLTWRNSADLAQIIDWIPTQPWATDKVGMIGISWEGTIQLTTCVYQPKHLTAISPMGCSQGFSAFCDNGLVLNGFFNVDWSDMRSDQEGQSPSLPVDGTEGDDLFRQAVAERVGITSPSAPDDPMALMKVARDQVIEMARLMAPEPPNPNHGPLQDSFDEYARINESGVAIMMVSGWWDMSFSGHVLDFFRALTVPKRLVMGPWNHLGPNASYREQLRWFDYWLRGVDNGIADEPPVQFASVSAFNEEVWHSAPAYPFPEVKAVAFNLHPNGRLCEQQSKEGALSYQVDYGVTLGIQSRSRFFFRKDKRIIPPELNRRAKQCLSFQTEPFIEDAQLCGRPELHLALATTGQSGAVVVTLEEVLSDGRAVYLTEGNLNLFHRKVSESQLPHEGSAFHSQNSEDLLPVTPGEVMNIGIELYPLAWKLQLGSVVRITLAGADADNLLVTPEQENPTWHLPFGEKYRNQLLLPLVDSDCEPSMQQVGEVNFSYENHRAFAYLQT